MKSLLKHIPLRSLFAATAVSLMTSSPAWAQAEETGPKGYEPSYMIIMFCVGLALLVICRSGKRSVSFARRED